MGLFFTKEQKMLDEIATQMMAHHNDKDPSVMRSLVSDFDNSLNAIKQAGRMEDDLVDKYELTLYTYRKHLEKMEKQAQTYNQTSVPASPVNQARFCSQCGNVLTVGANFCGICGAAVSRN